MRSFSSAVNETLIPPGGGVSLEAPQCATLYDLIVYVLCDTVLRGVDRWPGQWLEPVSMILHNLARYVTETNVGPTRKVMSLLDHCILVYEGAGMASRRPTLEEVSSKPMRNILSSLGTLLHRCAGPAVLLLEVWKRREGFESFSLFLEGGNAEDARYPFDAATRLELAARVLPAKVAAELAQAANGDLELLKSVTMVGMLPCEEEHMPQGVHDSHWRWHADSLYSHIRLEVMASYEMGSSVTHTPQKVLKSITSDYALEGQGAPSPRSIYQ